ncbi:MAG TPA: hypothetical protein VKR31_15690 [Rhizomicrobium sp.]|nr:hypothetical protein [Rhizomicrobium sp.]
MSIEADAGSSSAAQTAAMTTAQSTRPYFWSVRRELWESRAVWIAPLAAAGFVLFGFIVSVARTPPTIKGMSRITPENLMAIRVAPFGIAAVAIVLTSVVVGVFYCLGTLYNERRDRSILFWKSMPVSDLTTLLSKITVPMLILPIVAFVVICATELLMYLLDMAAYASRGGIFAQLWSQVPLPQVWADVAYGIVTLTLWHAPMYAYFLVLSAWAKKQPFLWAVVPPIGLSVFEKLAFDTSYISGAIHDRIFGSFGAAFTGGSGHMNFDTRGSAASAHGHAFHLPVPDPMKFVGTPGLWIGLVLAVGLFVAAVWLRRRREPM